MAKKEILFEDDFDFADYGRARSMGMSIDESLTILKIKKLMKKQKRMLKHG